MKCKIQRSRLKAILETIKPLAKTATIDASSNGWKIGVIDPAHVAMMRLDAVTEWFEEIEGKSNNVFTVNLESFASYLNNTREDNITLDTEAKDGKIIATDGTLTKTMGLVELEQTPKLPKIDLSVKFSVNRSDLVTAVKASSDVSDHLALKAGKGKLVISANGDTDDMELTTTVDYMGDPVRSLFPLDYFGNCLKATPGDCINVEMGNDLPVRLSFSDGEKAELSGYFLIAPRIETED